MKVPLRETTTKESPTFVYVKNYAQTYPTITWLCTAGRKVNIKYITPEKSKNPYRETSGSLKDKILRKAIPSGSTDTAYVTTNRCFAKFSVAYLPRTSFSFRLPLTLHTFTTNRHL
jgi:hypothetical protein